jgi:hypothetical protein
MKRIALIIKLYHFNGKPFFIILMGIRNRVTPMPRNKITHIN